MTTSETHYIVQTASESMPASCWGRYGRVAVLEVDAGLDRVSMISERARGCHRVVETWDRLNIGKTDRCAFSRACREARLLAHTLNESRKDQTADGVERVLRAADPHREAWAAPNPGSPILDPVKLNRFSLFDNLTAIRREPCFSPGRRDGAKAIP